MTTTNTIQTANTTNSTPATANVLTEASAQWARRPADERFASLEALHARTQHFKDQSVEAHGIQLNTLRVEAQSVDGMSEPVPVLVSPHGITARFTHTAMTQLARRVHAPADYLRTLPASLVATNLNHGMQRTTNTDNESMMFSQNGVMRLRHLCTSSYTRIWNADITARLLRLVDQQPQWQPAPAAFDGSRGLYASDADMFAFFVDNERRIFESLPGGGLGRGFFVQNSEVGTGAFKVTTFLYEFICGNHRVWGASDVLELNIRHVGNADERAFADMSIELRKYADTSADSTERDIKRMRTTVLGSNKEEVLDAVFGLRSRTASRKLLDASYDLSVEQEEWYGNPNTIWGLTGGMTQLARDVEHASDRVALERTAGKIMQSAL